MEADQFDELTRKLAAPVSRRLAIKAVFVTAVGGFFALNRAKSSGAATCDAGHSLCTAPNGNSRCIPCSSGKALYVPGNGPGTGCQCCASGAACTQNGKTTCAPACPGGTVLDPGTCSCVSTCESDEVLCNGNCVEACPNGSFLDAFCNCQCMSPTCGPSENQVCPNFFTDINNCGSCGNSCLNIGKPSVNDGVANYACCSGVCTNLSTDNCNCGVCGTQCTGGKTCQDGVCKCPGTTVFCGGMCVDVTSSNAFCSSIPGSCGIACPTGTACSNGVCTCLGQPACGNVCCASNQNCGPGPACVCSTALCNGICCQNNQFCFYGVCTTAKKAAHTLKAQHTRHPTGPTHKHAHPHTKWPDKK